MNTPSILTRIVEAARRQAQREQLHRERLEHYPPSDLTLAKDAKHAREMTRRQFAAWG